MACVSAGDVEDRCLVVGGVGDLGAGRVAELVVGQGELLAGEQGRGVWLEDQPVLDFFLLVGVGERCAGAAGGVAERADQLQVFDAGADDVEGEALRCCGVGFAQELA